MKARVLIFCATGTLALAPVLAQIPNGGFEDWSTVGSYQDPDNWITLNSATAGAGVFSCEEGIPGAVGNSFVKVTSQETVPDQPGSTVPGIIISGDPSTGTGGFPFTDRPDALNGSWQYGIEDNDAGNILVLLTKWNTVTQSSDPIGTASMPITGSLTSWQTFSIPISYSSELNPDTATIVIFSSAAAPVHGSFVWLDNLTFGSASTVGIRETELANGLKLYPSPTADFLHVTGDRPIVEVTVMDMTGRTVLDHVATGQELTFNVADLPSARYLAQVRMADGRCLVRSFVKK